MENNSGQQWFGFYAGKGHWIVNAEAKRVVYETKEMADSVLAEWQSKGEWQEIIVKECPMPPPEFVLGA